MARSRVGVERAVLVAVLLATAAAHVRGLGTGFLSDDFMILGHLDRVGAARGWGHAFLDLTGVLFYRPLLTGSYALDRLVWGLDPWGFHLTNLLLHVGVTALVYQVGRRLTGRATVGLIAAAWIGLQPMNPNTVTWIAGRVSLLGVFFPLLAVALFLTHRTRGSRVAAVTAPLALGLGLLAKESSIVVPFFLLLADWILPGRRAGRAVHVGLWGVLALYFVVRRLVLGVFLGGYGAAAEAAPVEAVSAAAQLGRSVLDAVADPGVESALLRGAVLMVVGLALGIWIVRRAPHGRAALVALLWAGAVTVLLYPSWELVPANAERWYPGLIGVALFMGIVLAGAGRLGPVLALVLVGAGLPQLIAREEAFREAGARARAVVARISTEPGGDGPLFVYGVPLTLGPAPFLHFGLSDALAPPFRASRREVFVVHGPHADGPARTDGAAHDRDLNPAAWLIAREGPVTVLRCDDDGILRERVGRTFLTDYDGFRVTRRARSLRVSVAPARWRPGAPFRVEVDAGGPIEEMRIDLFTAAGGLRIEGAYDPHRDLGPLVADHLSYAGCRRGYVVVTARMRGASELGVGGVWVEIGRRR